MPNDVTSTVTVTGPADAVDAFKRAHIRAGRGGNAFFDFETVIPMPTVCAELDEWSRKNWGTKWNSYDGEEVRSEPGKYVFRFCTAWSFPDPIFHALARLYPSLVFDVATYEENGRFGGVGHFNGHRDFQTDRWLARPEVYLLAHGRPKPNYDEDGNENVEVCTPLHERYPLSSATFLMHGDDAFPDRFCEDGSGLFRHRMVYQYRHELPDAACLPSWDKACRTIGRASFWKKCADGTDPRPRFDGVRLRRSYQATDGTHFIEIADYAFPCGDVVQYIEVYETHDAAGPRRIYPLSAAVHVLQNVTDVERWELEGREVVTHPKCRGSRVGS
jgi:hypothetical protein